MLLNFSAVPDGPPLSVQAIANSASSIIVSWTPPDLTLQNGLITNFKLLYTTNSSEQVDLRPVVVVNGTTLSYQLTSLQTNTHYFISVAAATSIGYGPITTISAVTLNIRK